MAQKTISCIINPAAAKHKSVIRLPATEKASCVERKPSVQ